jgi:predicted nucleic acid-binding Zn ribbon protein
MIYTWKCKNCAKVAEVERRVADIELQPDEACCAAPDRQRTIILKKGVKGFVLEGRGWHDTEYSSTRSIR